MYNYGSIWLNDIPMPDFLIVTGCSHDITGSIEHDTADIPGSNGVIIRSTKKNPRSIIFDFKYRDSGFLTYENKEEISNWIHSSNLKECKLELSWIPGSYYLVVPSGDTNLNDSPKIKSFSLEFLLVNPCRIENVEEVKTSGFTYIGTESTYPNLEFSVERACSKIKLEFSNTLDSGFIELNTSFNAGDKIAIDCKKKSIKVNDVDNMPILSIDSDFPKVENGWNDYKLTEGNVTFKILYSNMYR
ncbi:phage distal tail protein [Paraclostridium tenue]|uniref:Phage tail protein n=1 Tax=Paraclostridium tenue TaxID=1737 RepID=A0ABN1LXU0_9FIRM